MATFGEIVYSVLDLLKERSDDAYYTEEHVTFLASRIRSVLLERKYKQSRNSSFAVMSDENKQQICLTVSPANLLPDGCGGSWLKSDAEIPSLMSIVSGVTCTGHDLLPTMVTFIPKERMPYVGYNKWLRNIIYAARSEDRHLYLRSNNPQFIHLTRVGLTGVFEDALEAAKLSHEACLNGGICNILEQPFPLESALVPSCIEMVVAELIGSAYTPEDKQNNAKDDLPSEVNAKAGNRAPVENTQDNRRNEAE